MIDTRSSYRIADLIHSVSKRLARYIDLREPHRLAECSALRDAFITEVEDREGRLLAIVRDETEMQMQSLDVFANCDLERRPCHPEHIEEAANRLFDTVQAMPADRTDYSQIAFYIGLELAALWYPRCDGYREVTGQAPTAFRPMRDLPPVHSHHILLKSHSGAVRVAYVAHGQIQGLTPEDAEATWMYMPV